MTIVFYVVCAILATGSGVVGFFIGILPSVLAVLVSILSIKIYCTYIRKDTGEQGEIFLVGLGIATLAGLLLGGVASFLYQHVAITMLFK